MVRYNYERNNNSVFWAVIAFVLMFAALFGLSYFSASMEAAAYNRATGNNVSAWDAMWIELRVQDSPKEGE